MVSPGLRAGCSSWRRPEHRGACAPHPELNKSGYVGLSRTNRRMIFNSLTFVVFLLIVYSLYWALNHRWQNRLLLAASYVFYGWWDWRFLTIILGSSLLDYWIGL